MAVACPDVRFHGAQHMYTTGCETDAPATIYTASHDRDTGVEWFALCVRPRYEKLSATSLAGRGYETLLPLYKCSRRPNRYRDVQLPIFPGYLFCRFNPTARLPILTTPGVVHVVGCGRNPTPVDDVEMESIRRLSGLRLDAEPWPYLEVGQRVYIQGGPLKGTVGILLAMKNRYRLILTVTLLRRAVAVEIDRDWARAEVMCRP